MVEIYKGDIFKAPVDIIVHQSNCFHTMGSGIAKDIKKRYPRAYEADCMTKYGDQYKLGQFSFAAPNKDQDRWVINLYGQHRYGRDKRYTNYDALATGFEAIRSWLIKMDLDKLTVGMPHKLGCNNAGGDWGIVEGLIRNAFEGSKIKVLICKLDNA